MNKIALTKFKKT